MKGAISLLGLALLVCGTVVSGGASTITYTIAATGTGDLNGVTFANAAFTMSLLSNTSTVVNCGFGIFSNDIMLGAVSITGFSTASFVTPVRVFDTQPIQTAGLSRASCGGWDLIDFKNSAYASYNPMTSLGPTFSTTTFATDFFNCRGGCIVTSQGILDMSSVVNLTFSASTTTTPEPTTLPLLGIGSIAGWRRLRRRV